MELEGNETWNQTYPMALEVSGPNASDVGNDTSSLNCETFVLHYSIIPSVICVFFFIFGVLYSFFGYRLLKATMFVTSFIFGFSVVYFVCIEEKVLPLSGKIGVSLSAGLVCGLLAMLVLRIGLFITGFQSGVLVGVFFFTVLELLYHPLSRWIPIGGLILLGIVFSLLIMHWQKNLTIFATSVLGSALILLAVDYFADVFRMTEFCYDRLTARHSTIQLCWFSWLIFAIWPAFTAACVVIQCQVTAANYDHRAPAGVQRVANKNNQRQRFTGFKSDHDHYRHLYQIRRMNGDVIISKSYIKSIKEAHQSPSLKLLSSTTDTTNVDDIAGARTSLDDTEPIVSNDLENSSTPISEA